MFCIVYLHCSYANQKSFRLFVQVKQVLHQNLVIALFSTYVFAFVYVYFLLFFDLLRKIEELSCAILGGCIFV